MMKHVVISAFLLMAPIVVCADMMDDVLKGKYNARTLSVAQQDSILNPSNAPEENSMWRNYELRYENKQPLFRRSFMADYYLWDEQHKEKIDLGRVRDAKLSPNGKYVVYAKEDNNLYIFKTDFKTEVAITTDGVMKDGVMLGEKNIYNGVSDWLYEEEFGITSLFAFSPDSKQVVFVRLNENAVPSYEWQLYFSDESMQERFEYPTMKSLRYPKAGEANAQVSVCVYDIYHKSVKTLKIDTEGMYVPRVGWRQLPPAKKDEQPEQEVIVQRINRDQNKMDIYVCNPKSLVAKLLIKEYSNTNYVDYELFDSWQWLSDGRFVTLSEKNGWRQLFLHSADGIEQKCLTSAKMDITSVYGTDEANGMIYYQAAPTPMTRQCYALNMKKNTITCLTKNEGVHSWHFSSDWQRAIACYESIDVPNKYVLMQQNKGAWTEKKVIEDNKDIAKMWMESGLPNKEFFSMKSERGDSLYGWMILPKQITDKRRGTDKYPVVIMQYSGPGSQQVLNRWRKRFGHYLAAQGYVVVNVDPRGTDCRGRKWRNETYMQLGQKEAEDQLSVARYMQSLPYIDGKRIAMMGWSYGGFQTIRTMCEQGRSNEDLPIRCGVAIAPVTDWRLYDSGYTERFMQRPQVNEFGYNGSDLTAMAKDLKGELLIVHGMADDNVHVQNTLLMTEALVNAGKQFDMQLYADDNHFLKKGNHYRHLHDKIMKFLEDKLNN